MIFKVHDIFYACWQNKCVKYIHQHFETKWRSGTKSTYNFGNQKCHLLLSSSLALPSNRIFEKKTKNNSKYFQSRHFTINPDRFEVLSEEYYDPMWSKIRGGERWVDSRCIQSCNLDSVFAWYYSLSLPPIFFFFFTSTYHAVKKMVGHYSGWVETRELWLLIGVNLKYSVVASGFVHALRMPEGSLPPIEVMEVT